MKFTSRGFTLVELMIVIAIIGILAAALFPSLTAYLKRSRDAGRSANLNTIQTAIGAYYSDTESYPTATTGVGSGCINGTPVDSTNYFPKGVPEDPLGDQAQSPCGRIVGGTTAGKAKYGYASSSTASSTGFAISAKMENLAGGNWSGTAYTGQSVNVTAISAALLKGTGSIFILTN